jgi:hypothetical protein
MIGLLDQLSGSGSTECQKRDDFYRVKNDVNNVRIGDGDAVPAMTCSALASSTGSSQTFATQFFRLS